MIPAKASVNRTVTITARVANHGLGNSSGFQVAFYNASSRASPFAVVNVGPIGAGATSSVISSSWASPVLGPHRIWVEVDYGGAVPEGNETNNTASVTTAVVANIEDPRDAGRKKATARLRRSIRSHAP